MKPYRNRIVLLATVVGLGFANLGWARSGTAPHAVMLWDTGVPLGDSIHLTDRTAWKPVPPNLLMLEDDPQRALSSPAYYGREYAFQGDVVVENSYLTAVVWAGKGKVVVFSKSSKFEIGDSKFKAISRCTVLQNTGDDVALEISFSTGVPGADQSAVLAFGKTPIVEIKPAAALKGIRLVSPMAYGVAPGFIGDDLVLSPSQYPSDNTLYVPGENLFLGLLPGENSMLVLTWPKGRQ